MTASTTAPSSRRIDRWRPIRPVRYLAAATDIYLRLRMVEDLEAGATQHRLRAGPVRNPPVRLVSRVLLLDEVQPRVTGPLEEAGLRERVVLLERLHRVA